MTFNTYWTSESKQGDVLIGEYITREEAEADLEAKKAELMAQAFADVEGEDQSGLMTKSAVERGSWSIIKE